MSAPELPSGNIKSGNVFFLSGPSSTGKSTFSKSIPGAIHLEGDQFLAVTDLKFIQSHRGDALSLIKQTFKNQDPTLGQIFDVIQGKMKPEITPLSQTAFDEAKASIKSLMDDRWESVQMDGSRAIDPRKSQAIWQEVFITMLDEAAKLSSLGRTVIIDTVGMMGESPEVSTPDLKPVSPSLWVYKGMEIKQLLKYAAVDRVAQNILSRNVAGDTRTPLGVLNQYAERFKKAEEGDIVVGQFDVGKLEQWVNRFAYMKHLSIAPSTNLEEVDRSIQEGKKKLTQSQIGEIEKEMQSNLVTIKEKMNLIGDEGIVSITYRTVSTDGIIPQPKIIVDSSAIATKTEDVLPVAFKEFLDQVKTHPAFSGVITVQWGDAKPMAVVTENSRVQTPSFNEATSFNIMSGGKAFTATAIMQLVEQGKISLDTPLSEIGFTDRDYELLDADPKYREDLCPNPEYAKQVKDAIADFRKDGRITVGHLLRHQAGLDDDMSFKGLRFNKDMVGRAKYSNYGYQLLARVMTKVSGVPFTDYVQRHVLGVCGARASVGLIGSEPTPHECVMGELRENKGHPVPNADGNGCWWMTSGDLLKVAKAFSRGELCNASSRSVLTTPVEDGGPFARRACGMVVAPDANKPAVLFQGTFEGRSSAAFVVTGGEQPLVVSAVFNSIDGSNFWSDMVQLYRGEKVEKPLEGANFTQRVEKSKELYKRLTTDSPKDKERMKELLKEYAQYKDFAPDFVPISRKLEDDGFVDVAKLMREADEELRRGV